MGRPLPEGLPSRAPRLLRRVPPVPRVPRAALLSQPLLSFPVRGKQRPFSTIPDPRRAQDAVWSSPGPAVLPWGSELAPGAVGKHPAFVLSGLGQRLSSLLPDPAPSHTVCPVHRLTIHLQFHLVLVLGSGGRRGFGEKLRTGTGGGKRDTFASFLGTPGSVHFSATCLHKPWAAWSSRDPLPGAAWTWGSWAEKGASVEISFPTSEHQV